MLTTLDDEELLLPSSADEHPMAGGTTTVTRPSAIAAWDARNRPLASRSSVSHSGHVVSLTFAPQPHSGHDVNLAMR